MCVCMNMCVRVCVYVCKSVCVYVCMRVGALNSSLKTFFWEKASKMVVWEDPELTPTRGNTKYTLTCRAVSPEKDSRTDGTATAYR